MEFDPIEARRLLTRESSRPHAAAWLSRADLIAQLAGVTSTVLMHGLGPRSAGHWELGALTFLAMAVISLGFGFRYRWSLIRRTLRRDERSTLVVSVLWIAGVLLLTVFGPALHTSSRYEVDRWTAFVQWSEMLIVCRAAFGTVKALRTALAQGANPAVLLVASFVLLISLGTAMLMLPACRAGADAEGTGAPFVTALFTATSASCVTGLIVEPTGTYWSDTGHVVILALFQIGGLGIMTYGAFFAVAAGRNVNLKEFSTLRELLASEGLGDARRLLLTIVGCTFGIEFAGAVALAGLWPEEPLLTRTWMALFHSVSAFCNAGFALTDDSFVGLGDRWQVWGALAILIILGGLGFSTLNDATVWLRTRLFERGTRLQKYSPRPSRLALTSRLSILTSIWLLTGGTLLLFVLEGIGARRGDGADLSVADAWFQSVTFRTAGFNTVDLGGLQPSSKLIAILLMFIGASPGSTGGGVKTVVFAVSLLGVSALLNGRPYLECRGRMIPSELLNRAVGILLLAGTTVIVATLLICLFEQHPERFLDHLFEATSAAGTVGVSTGLRLPDGTVQSTTQSLSMPSRFVVIVAMFLGRVGPLTLLLALTGKQSTARYEYPTDRVTLT